MKRVLLVLVAVTALVSACGDDEEDSAGTGAAAGRPAKETAEPPVQLEGTVNNRGEGPLFTDSLTLDLGDFFFAPTYVEAAQAATGTLTLKNDSGTSHTFTVPQLDIDQEVRPGETKEIQIQLPQTGDVPFFCRFHKDQGMQGAFYVRGGR